MCWIKCLRSTWNWNWFRSLLRVQTLLVLLQGNLYALLSSVDQSQPALELVKPTTAVFSSPNLSSFQPYHETSKSPILDFFKADGVIQCQEGGPSMEFHCCADGGFQLSRISVPCNLLDLLKILNGFGCEIVRPSILGGQNPNDVEFARFRERGVKDGVSCAGVLQQTIIWWNTARHECRVFGYSETE